ncbi:lytic transglycosylase domain-containing protein [Bdellovibrionota bacterium FG-2]
MKVLKFFIPSVFVFAVFSVVIGLTLSTAVFSEEPKQESPFRVDERLQKNVQFWVRIYSQYSTYQGVIHDSKYIDRIYEVIDLRSEAKEAPKKRRKRFKESQRKWTQILLSIHKKQKAKEKFPTNLTNEERRVFEMFADIDEPDKFVNATQRKRIRMQLGQKDRFMEGLKFSGRYLPQMEQVFKAAGLPVELTRLPFVESSFNVDARSKVGASGIWQFMRSTGRLFLKINSAVDERNDPIRATEAAARLLQMNYEHLKNWPLAVTAYNHGLMGMERAVKKVGSEDLEDLVEDYRSRRFGFASTNFFTEFLAALEVEKNADRYFGPVERYSPIPAYEVKIPRALDVRVLVQFLRLDLKALDGLNPGVKDAVFTGRMLLPAGYLLRIPLPAGEAPPATPESAARVFLAGYEQIPDIYKVRGQRLGKYGKPKQK